MGDTFQYAVGVGPPIVLLALVIAGFLFDIRKKRHLRRTTKGSESVNTSAAAAEVADLTEQEAARN
jgi:hypothetical protein